MPRDEPTTDPHTHDTTDPGLIVGRLLDMVQEQNDAQNRTLWRFMILFVILMVINAGISGVDLLVRWLGVEVSGTGAPVVVEAAEGAAEEFVGPLLDTAQPDPAGLVPDVEPDPPLDEGPP